MPPCPPILLRVAAAGILLAFTPACQPIGGADPLDRGNQPLATIATVPGFNPNDEGRILQDRTIRVAPDSSNDTATKTQAGMTVTSEW